MLPIPPAVRPFLAERRRLSALGRCPNRSRGGCWGLGSCSYAQVTIAARNLADTLRTIRAGELSLLR